MGKSPVVHIDSFEVDELILKVLSRNLFGLSKDKIRRELPPAHRISTKQINGRLDDLLGRGRVYAWHPPAGKTKKPPAPRYAL